MHPYSAVVYTTCDSTVNFSKMFPMLHGCVICYPGSSILIVEDLFIIVYKQEMTVLLGYFVECAVLLKSSSVYINEWALDFSVI